MSRSVSIKETADLLKEHNNFLILTHIRPDGDTLGSAGALAQGLRKYGKTAYILRNFEATPRYRRYVDGNWASDDYKPDCVISVDTATTELLPENALPYIKKISLCIDHHGSNTMYADNVCCLPDYASCGEIIFGILEQLNIFSPGSNHFDRPDISYGNLIDCLYIAVSTDTGCFTYGNTTANTHAVAAQLIKHGASHREINKLLFRTKSRARILLEGMVLSGIEFYYAGQVAFVTITRKMMDDSGAKEDDIEDISNLASSIEGVNIGITIREMTPDTGSKISVRTTPLYNASELCRRFGGGGHAAAAGASIAKPVTEVKKELLSIFEEYTFKPAMPDIKL